MKIRSSAYNSRLLSTAARQCGATLLELLVALAVLGLALGLSFPALHASSHLVFRIQAQEHGRTKAILALTALEDGIRRAGSLSAAPGIRIQPPGAVLFADGSFHRVHRSQPRLCPRPEMNAATFLALDVRWLFKAPQLLPHISASTLPDGRYCMEHAEIGREDREYLGNIRLWLGISLEGLQLFRGEARLQSTSFCPSRNSLVIALAPEQSPMFTFGGLSSARSAVGVLGLIPVSDCYTIYLDEEGTLRRLSHLTSENQPIVYGIRSLMIAEINTARGLQLLTLSLVTERDGERGYAITRRYIAGTEEPQSSLDLLF